MSKRVRLLGIVLLLSLLICPSVLAKGPVELQFWTTFTGPDGPYMERMVNQFNADPEGEIEVELPNRYRLSPQLASAMKAVAGVVDVELV